MFVVHVMSYGGSFLLGLGHDGETCVSAELDGIPVAACQKVVQTEDVSSTAESHVACAHLSQLD